MYDTQHIFIWHNFRHYVKNNVQSSSAKMVPQHSILSWCSIELTCQLRKTLFSAGATDTECKQNKILRKQKSKTKHPSSSGCNHSKEFPIRCLFTGYRKVSIIVDVFCAKTCLNFHHLSYGCDATRSVGRVISD